MNADPGKNELVIFEDEHLLVVNKPAGLNTLMRPVLYAGEGIYEWLKNRDSALGKASAIIHQTRQRYLRADGVWQIEHRQ